MLPSTPQAMATPRSSSPLAARYPAGGITSSLGRGRTDDSTAISTMMPGYPSCRKRSSSHCTNPSSIEAVLSQQRDEARVAQRSAAHSGPVTLHQGEHLAPPCAQRYHQAPLGCELLHERRWDFRAPSGDENRVEWCIRAPAKRPV